eukprot:g2827.t1
MFFLRLGRAMGYCRGVLVYEWNENSWFGETCLLGISKRFVYTVMAEDFCACYILSRKVVEKYCTTYFRTWEDFLPVFQQWAWQRLEQMGRRVVRANQLAAKAKEARMGGNRTEDNDDDDDSPSSPRARGRKSSVEGDHDNGPAPGSRRCSEIREEEDHEGSYFEEGEEKIDTQRPNHDGGSNVAMLEKEVSTGKGTGLWSKHKLMIKQITSITVGGQRKKTRIYDNREDWSECEEEDMILADRRESEKGVEKATSSAVDAVTLEKVVGNPTFVKKSLNGTTLSGEMKRRATDDDSPLFTTPMFRGTTRDFKTFLLRRMEHEVALSENTIPVTVTTMTSPKTQRQRDARMIIVLSGVVDVSICGQTVRRLCDGDIY